MVAKTITRWKGGLGRVNDLVNDLNLVRKVAWSFTRTTGQEFDELFSEAALAYLEALKRYDPEKASFSTWAVKFMTNQLISFCAKEEAYSQFFEFSDTTTLGQENQERDYLFKEWIVSLPHDLQLICKIIFSAPSEILAESPKASRGRLIRKLRECGWSWVRIWDGVREMKRALNENGHFSII